MTNTPNSTEEVQQVEAAETTQQPATPEVGTEQTETVQTEQTPAHAPETVDYRQKYIASAKGANALLEENKKLKADLAEAAKTDPAGTSTLQPTTPVQPTSLYPGFENLPADEKDAVTVFADTVTQKTLEQVNSNPALSFAEKQYNESRWEEAFTLAAAEFPELASIKEDFKSKYFHPNHVPENISEIINTMAQAELYQKMKQSEPEATPQTEGRIEMEGPTGGDKTPPTSRSLQDWEHLARTNPAKFASLKSQYEADVSSGKFKE